MRLVIALGGNALLKRGEILSADNQRRNMAVAAAGLAAACDGHEVVIVHGNGPQVGLLALEADAYADVPPYPLDMLGAESQGQIGYVIVQALRNARPGRAVVALITQTVVSRADPAFARPTKPIGPVYAADRVAALQAEHGWSFAPDGKAMRRVVSSPVPVEVIELATIRQLMDSGVIVVCTGGGGIPVERRPDDSLAGVEAVIDKDRAAALIAEQLGADRLILLTDVDAVYTGWGTPGQTALRKVRAGDLHPQDFAEGSMRPKVEAACSFAERSGHPAVIGALSAARNTIEGYKGTEIAA
ncbi:carbamate kinase [Polymorphobacter arshaanensis]|uniref:Carbamate kinase n=1 Tax=Glacieibacterium arshaanense TaxID=2511025 RepID=A0A4Y9ESK0_9SPHN|nr:carbamate kinase [Polymorphobacter arshaanensis]TFU05878.1 carbamate kinase [Polymorphobacter arshaanensis]